VKIIKSAWFCIPLSFYWNWTVSHLQNFCFQCLLISLNIRLPQEDSHVHILQKSQCLLFNNYPAVSKMHTDDSTNLPKHSFLLNEKSRYGKQVWKAYSKVCKTNICLLDFQSCGRPQNIQASYVHIWRLQFSKTHAEHISQQFMENSVTKRQLLRRKGNTNKQNWRKIECEILQFYVHACIHVYYICTIIGRHMGHRFICMHMWIQNCRIYCSFSSRCILDLCLHTHILVCAHKHANTKNIARSCN